MEFLQAHNGHPSGGAPQPSITLDVSAPRLTGEEDYVHQNRVINSWYHKVDLAFREYLGRPELPNWATYGKFVSHNAGEQLRDIERVMKILDGFENLQEALADGFQPTPAEIRLIFGALTSIARNGISLAWNNLDNLSFLNSLGTAGRELLLVIDQRSSGEEIKIDEVSLARVDTISELRELFLKHRREFRECIESIHSALRSGNRAIYDYMSVNVSAYLEAVNREGVDSPPRAAYIDDERGFFRAAMERYYTARLIGLEMTELKEGAPMWIELQSKRAELVREANLFLVFNEQSCRVQPLYDGLLAEIDVITNDAALRDSAGRYRLLPRYRAGNWGDIYSRMGIDPVSAPEDHRLVTPLNFPALLPAKDPRFAGTIADYFERALSDPSVCTLLKKPPSSCIPL